MSEITCRWIRYGSAKWGFNPEMRDDRYLEKYPYIVTKEVVLRNVEATSTRRLRISDNDYLFRRTVIR